MNYFNYNGKLLQENELIIGPTNRGLRYGDGIFETIKYINGKLILGNEHFARFWKGMQMLQFDIPKHLTPEKLETEIQHLVKRNRLNSARIRLTAIRGDGGIYDPKNHHPHYIIEAIKLPEDNGPLNVNGLQISLFEDAVKSIDAFSNLKTNNYLPYFMGAMFAKQQQCNDALILNSKGNICDSTIANIFLVKNEIIYTPALSEGCVAGVMRQALLQFLKANNYQMEERAVTQVELFAADEVFFTNSMYTIRWVQSIADVDYANTFTQKIYAAFVPTIC